MSSISKRVLAELYDSEVRISDLNAALVKKDNELKIVNQKYQNLKSKLYELLIMINEDTV